MQEYNIDSNDEFQDIGNGMNQMAENLNKYVKKAYVAEIRQKRCRTGSTEKNRSSHTICIIQLDVIRMSAITNDDMLVGYYDRTVCSGTVKISDRDNRQYGYFAAGDRMYFQLL